MQTHTQSHRLRNLCINRLPLLCCQVAVRMWLNLQIQRLRTLEPAYGPQREHQTLKL